MITFEKDKQKLDLINHSEPILNFKASGSFSGVASTILSNKLWALQSWHYQYQVNINNLNDKKSKFSKMMRHPPLGRKVLGSGNYLNYIWILWIEDRFYIFYISKRGLSIETIKINSFKLIKKDLNEIIKYLNLDLKKVY